MDLDETDLALLRLLKEDARLSHRHLARNLGVAQGTVTNRLRRLEEEAALRAATGDRVRHVREEPAREGHGARRASPRPTPQVHQARATGTVASRFE